MPDARLRRADGDWPHTTRLLPWLLAAFIAMLWLLPFDAVKLGGGGPVDLTLDRIAMLALGLVWVGTLLTGGDRLISFKPSGLHVAVLAFVLVAMASVVVNASTLARLSELELAVKQVALLVSYATFFFIVTTIVRPSEVRAFVVLMLALACVTAVGLAIEFRTDYNAFYEWAEKLFPSPFRLTEEPPNEKYGRRSITGPAAHGIAAAAMFAMMLPFAVAGMMRHGRGGRHRLYTAATGLLLLGAIATQRKTGLVVPAAALLALVLLAPRQMVRLLPIGIALLIGIQAAAPGALVGIKAQLVGPQTNSTTGRTSDYDATAPDIRDKPAFGRGHGSYAWQKYRFLDNEYLHRVIETGFIGLAAYLALILGVAGTGLRARRRAGPSERGSPAMAAVAAAAAYAAASAVFDELFFPHAPYLFFLIGGLTVCYAAGLNPRAAAPLPVRPAPGGAPGRVPGAVVARRGHVAGAA